MNSVIDLSKAERREVAPVSEATALIQIIERAARDPSVDIERMERLLQMHERLVARQAEAAYADALARLQPKLPIIQERGAIKNNSGAVQSKYALWEDIVGVITPILAVEGFSLSFRIAHPDGKIEVTGVLTHRQGHSEKTPILLPADTSGNKNAVQAVASSVSYGKRYTAGALLNLRTGELDDDAQSAASVQRVSPEQVAAIKARMKDAGTEEARFLSFWKIDSVEEIPAFNFEPVMEMLSARAKRVDPRGDLSGVDMKARDRWVSQITDILNQDKEEKDVARDLQEVAVELNKFQDLYISVLDELARLKIISKANWRKFTSMLVDP